MNNLKKVVLNKFDSLIFLSKYKIMIEIIVINKSGKKGPDIKAGGINITSIDVNIKKL
tara:strand:+ start:192 stop:365 length:174 start_codon:yes stop_codon:yes gene_type:complete